MMKQPTLSLLAITLLASSSAHATPQKRAAPAEIYAATEDRFTPATMIPTPVEVTSSVRIRTQVASTAESPRKLAPKQVAPVTEVISEAPETAPATVPVTGAAPASSFDMVPANQAQSIVKRLKLIELLISRHNRAYDYRAHTFKELESILAELDAPKKVEAAPAPVIVRQTRQVIPDARVKSRLETRRTVRSESAPDLSIKELPTPEEPKESAAQNEAEEI